jgi:hypothetical protein
MSINVYQLKPRLGVLAAVLAIGLFLAAGSAQAIVFNLDSDHCSGGCGPTPFGTVSLTQSGTTVDITVHLLNGNSFAKTQAADDMAFKFNGTGVSLADITVEQTVPGQTLAAETGSFNGDGTGAFTFGIECTTCGMGGSDAFTNDIVFHVANATIADLTQGNGTLFNGQQIVFVADILSGTTGNTGPVDATGPGASTPDAGSTAQLLGLGLLGLGFVAQRRKRA